MIWKVSREYLLLYIVKTKVEFICSVTMQPGLCLTLFFQSLTWRNLLNITYEKTCEQNQCIDEPLQIPYRRKNEMTITGHPHYSLPHCNTIFNITFPCHASQNGYFALLYLINIHWLSVDFDWSRAGHAEGAIVMSHDRMSHDHITLRRHICLKKCRCTCSHM